MNISSEDDDPASEPGSPNGSGPRQLLVMRHAKAAYPDDCTDHERPLTPRGRKEALEVGEWLAHEGLVPDLILCSDAARTVETTQEVLEGIGQQLPTMQMAELYEAHVSEVVEAVNGAPAEVQRVLVVGHEPTMSATVSALAGTSLRFTTAGVAVLEHPGPWPSLEPDSCSLDQFRTPKDS